MKSRRGIGIGGVVRFTTILRVLAKHGLGGLFDCFRRKTRRPKPKNGLPAPHRIRAALEELGPSFVKLGQLMSTRADIFPPAYIDAFKKLQDSVPPADYAEIKTVIETELQQPLEMLFKTFDPAAIAAASVAQVHIAELFSGEKVAVKIVRPGIARKIRQDLRLMYSLARRIEKSFAAGRLIGAVNLVEEFERTIIQELDMRVEAASIQKFGENFKDMEEILIPGVFWEITTRSVLVMSHVEGIKMDAVDKLRSQGIDPRRIAVIGLHAFSRQLMEFGFFHADPHPANTIVMPDGRVALVDFGITGRLDEESMLQVAKLLLGFAEHNYDLVVAALLDMGLIDDARIDLKRFRADLKDVSEPFYHRSLQHITARDVYDQAIGLVLKYRLKVPRSHLLLAKTFIQTEALGKILNSDASLLQVARPYAAELIQRAYDTRRMLHNFGRDAHLFGRYLKTAPKFFHDILRQTAEGRQRIEFYHRGFEQIDRQVEKGVNRLTIGLIISASIIAAAMVLNSGQRFIDFKFAWLEGQSIPLTAVLGLIGYSIATLLGVLLIVLIIRSGRL